MDWLAVRAGMEMGFAVAGAEAEPEAAVLGAGFAGAVAAWVPFAVAGGLSRRWPSADRPAAMLVFPAVAGANSVLLAGTSLRNEAKIWLASGCFHRTFAVSPGTTWPRGMFGIVKKAILLDGIPRSDCPRL